MIENGGKIYAVPDLDSPSEYLDLADFTLADLALKIGDKLELIYDFGTEQHFLLTLTASRGRCADRRTETDCPPEGPSILRHDDGSQTVDPETHG